MKTIEERAEEYSKDNWGMGYSKEMEILRSREGYIRGATDQAEITKQEMIEKACKWTCSQCPLRCRHTLTSGYVACAKHIDRNECNSLQSLIKTMEE